jgi:hypothetical protein
VPAQGIVRSTTIGLTSTPRLNRLWPIDGPTEWTLPWLAPIENNGLSSHERSDILQLLRERFRMPSDCRMFAISAGCLALRRNNI